MNYLIKCFLVKKAKDISKLVPVKVVSHSRHGKQFLTTTYIDPSKHSREYKAPKETEAENSVKLAYQYIVDNSEEATGKHIAIDFSFFEENKTLRGFSYMINRLDAQQNKEELNKTLNMLRDPKYKSLAIKLTVTDKKSGKESESWVGKKESSKEVNAFQALGDKIDVMAGLPKHLQGIQ